MFGKTFSRSQADELQATVGKANASRGMPLETVQAGLFRWHDDGQPDSCAQHGKVPQDSKELCYLSPQASQSGSTAWVGVVGLPVTDNASNEAVRRIM